MNEAAYNTKALNAQTTEDLLANEKALQEAKHQKITELLKEKLRNQQSFEATKKRISEELKSLGHHVPRQRKSKAQTGAAK